MSQMTYYLAYLDQALRTITRGYLSLVCSILIYKYRIGLYLEKNIIRIDHV